MTRQGEFDRNKKSAAVSEARLTSVFDTAADGIVVINEDGLILAFNKASEQLFGYKASELIGRNVDRLMPEAYASEHAKYMQNYFDTGHRKIIGIGREVEGKHKDGTVFPVELSVGEAATPDGRQFIGILRDLRSRKQIEDRLAKTQAQLVHLTRISALDEMGAAIAHEINQPLTAVMLYLQSVSRKARIDGSVDANILEVIDKAVREAERAGEIIQRMRQLVERKPPERQDVDIRELVEGCLEMAKLGASDDRLKIVSEIEEYLPSLKADPVQIRQVLINLLRNAADAVSGQSDKAVSISVAKNKEIISFRVTDNGPGVPEELIENLFRAFSGAKHKGVGLGLAISRSIAQNHGGDLRHEKNPVGRGATFVLSLPFNPPVSNHGLNPTIDTIG